MQTLSNYHLMFEYLHNGKGDIFPNIEPIDTMRIIKLLEERANLVFGNDFEKILDWFMHTEGVASNEERENLAAVIRIINIEKKSLERIKKQGESTPGHGGINMNSIKSYQEFAPNAGIIADAIEYWTDSVQRSILFMDALRKRGNVYLEHLKNGQPPVLTFEYETIFPGTSLDRPVNYDLVRIVSKSKAEPVKGKRPIVIIDPRAGHGPGIGGSKIDSQVGIALSKGHPVYFVLFHPEPVPGQTLEDVKNAEIRFIEEVGNLHPEEDKPSVMGNCQAGWAVALLSAERPDVTGPLVLNGSPLSYWAGLEGKNQMRYRGGVVGGIWIACLFSDLGNGKFDGAHLVANFELLNPANTFWSKQYNLYSNIDTEEERYLDFEKWWNGYFYMTAEEISFIVGNLFMGDKLEQGKLALSKGRSVDLKNLDDPILMFASKGDNITPPQQALNWIAKVYESVDEIKRCGQIIVYTLHEKIGHLGIFVSACVAKKQHRHIIDKIDMLEFLPPGLYEMVFRQKEGDLPVTEFEVVFERRDIGDILAMDDGLEDEEDFEIAAAVSELNHTLYEAWISPWLRTMSNEFTAEALRQLHPLRMSRYMFTDMNPFLVPLQYAAPLVKDSRTVSSEDNVFQAMEKSVSACIETMLNLYRDTRDDAYELAFKLMYGNPLLKSMLVPPKKDGSEIQPEKKEKPKPAGKEKRRIPDETDKGGFADGVVRIMLAMADADLILDPKELEIAEKTIKANERLRKLASEDYKRMVKEQSRILEANRDRALESLASLLPTEEDRLEAMEIAKNIADADLVLAAPEKTLMKKLGKALNID